MVRKINRSKCIEQYSQLAHLEENNIIEGNNSFYPEVFASYALTYTAPSFAEHAGVMAEEFTQMVREFGYDCCLFFPNENKPWIQDPGSDERLMEAIDFLFEQNIDADFNGGLRVSIRILPIFMKHVMILAHYCNAFPYISFIDETRNFLCNICSHGNIHVDILNHDCIHLSLDSIEKSKLILIENSMCHPIYEDSHSLKTVTSYLSL